MDAPGHASGNAARMPNLLSYGKTRGSYDPDESGEIYRERGIIIRRLSINFVHQALRILATHGHTVHRVPGLEPIIRDDISAFPNYTNGVLLNEAALVPAYGRREDEVVQEILRNYGYEVYPIDCSNIILTNSAIHCISKTALKIGPQT